MARREVIGIAELRRNLNNLATILENNDVKEGILGIAEEMKSEMKSRAPVKTGNLRRSIKAELFKKQGQSIAFVAVDRKIAPHAHLVEFGHRNRDGSTTPPHPFFAPVISRYRGRKYVEKVETVLKAKLNKAK